VAVAVVGVLRMLAVVEFKSPIVRLVRMLGTPLRDDERWLLLLEDVDAKRFKGGAEGEFLGAILGTSIS
jgi:hypothetical protein